MYLDLAPSTLLLESLAGTVYHPGFRLYCEQS